MSSHKLFPHGTNSTTRGQDRIPLWQHIAEAMLTMLTLGVVFVVIVSAILWIDRQTGRRDPWRTIPESEVR